MPLGVLVVSTVEELESLESCVATPHILALSRIACCDEDDRGMAAKYQPLLNTIFSSWFHRIKHFREDDIGSLARIEETLMLQRAINAMSKIAENDATLEEEFGHEGSHFLLSKLARFDPYSHFNNEFDRDTAMELQNDACEVAANNSGFPLKISPFDFEAVRRRLPLIFHINSKADSPLLSSMSILIHQVVEQQSEQKDVGFVMWPSAVALSHWLVTESSKVVNRKILELGAGCGLVGLIAAYIQNTSKERGGDVKCGVTLTDFNATVMENCGRNIKLNDLDDIACVAGLDFYDQNEASDGWVDMGGVLHDQVDVILGADIICQPDDAFAAARSIKCALKSTGVAYIICADSKHRFGVDHFQTACKQTGLDVQVDRFSSTEHADFAESLYKTAGYVDGMDLIRFTVRQNATK